ncbi:MAG TPA: C25 family cysteine peptidase [Myxococcota bacterium]|nr:C25 family cysteine peptidase [Myxococcota bacterium]
MKIPAREKLWIVFGLFILASCNGTGEYADSGYEEQDGVADAGLDAGADQAGDQGSDPGDEANADQGSDLGADPGGDFNQACEQGIPSSVDIIDASEMLIVTNDVLRPAFEVLADWKRAKGVPTSVVTTAWIDANSSGRDAAERLRGYIHDMVFGSGVRYVLLGGDAEVVPVRRVHARALMSYDDIFVSDFYFSDLDGNWDANGDDVFGEPADDLDMHPDVALGRVPASTPADAETFVNRVLAYEQTDPGCARDALFISEDTGFLNFDAAVQLNPLADDVFPADFRKQKLYWKYEGYPGAEPNTKDAQIEALEAGRAFVTHYGHASEQDLNLEMTAGDVSSLSNSPHFPIYISCGCQAGNFAYASSDSAGERLLTNPGGGAVAYLGNTNFGLGPGGGTALIESFYRGIFEQGLDLGSALDYAREHFYTNESSLQNELLGIRWTQLVVVLLGDPEMPVYTTDPGRLSLEAPAAIGRDEQCVAVTVLLAGQPIPGARVTLYRNGEFLYRQESDAQGRTVFRFTPQNRGQILLTATLVNAVPALGNIAVP